MATWAGAWFGTAAPGLHALPSVGAVVAGAVVAGGVGVLGGIGVLVRRRDEGPQWIGPRCPAEDRGQLERWRSPDRPLASIGIGWTLLVSLLLMGAAAMGGSLRAASVEQARGQLEPWVGSGPASVRLTLTTDPVPTSTSVPGRERVRFQARLEHVRDAPSDTSTPRGPHAGLDLRVPVLVVADGSWGLARAGNRAWTSGRLVSQDGGPSPLAALLVIEDEVAGESLEPRPPYAWAEPFRRALSEAAADREGDVAGLLPALVLGDESRVSPVLREDMRVSGLGHLTAVSGANVAIVVGTVLLLSRRLGLRGRGLVVVSLATILVFVVLARPQPSVLRAAVMGAVAAAVLVTGARGRGVAALSLAVVALLLVDPWLARTMGFALSVAATAGILGISPTLRERLGPRVPDVVAWPVVVTLSAQAAVLPLLVSMTSAVSLVSVPANLLAGPLVAPATVLGFLAAVVGPLSPTAAAVLAWLGGVPTLGIATVAHRAADQPGALTHVSWGWPTAVALAVVAVCLLRRVLSSAVVSIAVCLALMLLVVRPVPGTSWPPPDWSVIGCDVGQGDALLLRSGPRSAVVVDAGPDPARMDRCLRRAGVDEIPLVVISHLHADHVDGISGISHPVSATSPGRPSGSSGARRRPVGAVLTTPTREPARGDAMLRAWASAVDAPLGDVGLGDQIHVSERLSLRVLGPGAPVREGSVPNQASVVLMATVDGIRVLLTGDIEAEAQRALLSRGGGVGADVLKVAHHGSADIDPALVTSVDPQVALISVGAGNDYGHPAPSTLRQLSYAGATAYRTDTNGDLAVSGGADGLRVTWSGASAS